MFDRLIHQLVEHQVKITPDAIAVTFAGKQLTYSNRQGGQVIVQ